jgi:hypothetical protein
MSLIPETTHRMRPQNAMVLLVLAAVGLAACSTSHARATPSATSSPSQTASVPPSTLTTSSSLPTTSSITPVTVSPSSIATRSQSLCSPPNVALAVDSALTTSDPGTPQGAGKPNSGAYYLGGFTLTNTGPYSCTIGGYLSVSAYTPASVPIDIPVQHISRPTARFSLTIASHSAMAFYLGAYDEPGYPTCPQVGAYHFDVQGWPAVVKVVMAGTGGGPGGYPVGCSDFLLGPIAPVGDFSK